MTKKSNHVKVLNELVVHRVTNVLILKKKFLDFKEYDFWILDYYWCRYCIDHSIQDSKNKILFNFFLEKDYLTVINRQLFYIRIQFKTFTYRIIFKNIKVMSTSIVFTYLFIFTIQSSSWHLTSRLPLNKYVYETHTSSHLTVTFLAVRSFTANCFAECSSLEDLSTLLFRSKFPGQGVNYDGISFTRKIRIQSPIEYVFEKYRIRVIDKCAIQRM